MVLKQIRTKNIQSHREVVIDLQPTGIHVFAGDNGNGKSVILKTTQAIITNKIRHPNVRASLVNRETSFGEIEYTREDDVKLLVHITREAAGTWISYTESDKESITRYLSDKSHVDLIRLFGWHYDEQSGITLNVRASDESLLFYKTPFRTNATIMESATTDSSAQRVVDSFSSALKDARKYKDQYSSELTVYTTAMNDLKVCDEDALKEEREKLARLYKNLKAFYFPTLPIIKAVPQVKLCQVYVPRIPVIKFPKIANIRCELPDILPVARELRDLHNYKCPTCGRGFDCGC